MKVLRLTAPVLLLALLVTLFFLQPFQVGAATTLVSDSYSRTLTDSWGSASSGGAYTLSGTAANFDVNGWAGTMSTPAGATRSASLKSVSVRDLDATFRVSANKSSGGGGQAVYFAGRVNSAGAYYARVRFPTDTSVRIQGVRESGGVSTVLGTETLTGLKQTAGTFFRLRTQMTGANPTTIRIRIWLDGQAEPTSWQYTATDSASGLQTAGYVGLRTYLSGTATNGPVLATFDDWTVSDIGSSPPPPPPPPPPSGTNTLYWGALVNGVSPMSSSFASGGAYYNFEQKAGKKMGIIHWGQPWKMNGSMQPFQTSYFDNVRNHGSIPMINWASWELGMGINQSAFQLSDIYNGNYDSYIRQWATDAKAWGHPFFMRFDHEMNGWWYPWSEGKNSSGVIPNGNQPGDFVKAWRHIHDIFTSVGATNTTWVWCANHESTSSQYPPMSQVYPGDSYVDWTCVDGYNKYSTWISFNTVMTGSGTTWLRNTYNDLVALSSKPIMIGETASLEAGDGGTKKANWITDAYKNQLIYNFPKVKAVVWFNWNEGSAAESFPIDTTSASLTAFKSAISLSNYPANQYSGLNTSPIPPP